MVNFRGKKNEDSSSILLDKEEASAARFDAVMYGIELAYLAGKKYTHARKDFINFADLKVWLGIRKVIEHINNNAAA